MAVETRPEEQAIPTAERGGRAAEGEHARAPDLLQRWRQRTSRSVVLSPLTQRILLLNVAALIILGMGLGYLSEYQRGLVKSELESITTEARIFAGALGESAVTGDNEGGFVVVPEQSRLLLRRLIEPTKARARLFLPSGALIVDSRFLIAPGGAVQIVELPPPEAETPLDRFVGGLSQRVKRAIPGLGALPRYHEAPEQNASDYPEVIHALAGRADSQIYDNGTQGAVLSVAVPVQRYKFVVGALMVSRSGAEIDAAMRAVRFDILKAFAFALLFTTLFSIYLGSAIVRPIRRLAQAAERIRPGRRGGAEIPDFSGRRDEIGDLSQALRRMTELLSQRMMAIERFAADVAHEIKNPLSSLRSAVETAARVKEPEQQQRLMAIILEDVHRLDRLISDISHASRLDAELARDEAETIDLRELLGKLVEHQEMVASPSGPRLYWANASGPPLPVRGVEGRLAQVFRNLIDNAVSFSPTGGIINVSARTMGDQVEALVEDEGPGLPEGKLEAIFERFYSERPAGEKFGAHSGLGLSISKQIVEAHSGTIRAENRRDSAGRVRGARFIVSLPLETGRASAARH
jgi:two-component system sensor histidine kinase ChvG